VTIDISVTVTKTSTKSNGISITTRITTIKQNVALNLYNNWNR